MKLLPIYGCLNLVLFSLRERHMGALSVPRRRTPQRLMSASRGRSAIAHGGGNAGARSPAGETASAPVPASRPSAAVRQRVRRRCPPERPAPSTPWQAEGRRPGRPSGPPWPRCGHGAETEARSSRSGAWRRGIDLDPVVEPEQLFQPAPFKDQRIKGAQQRAALCPAGQPGLAHAGTPSGPSPPRSPVPGARRPPAAEPMPPPPLPAS